MGAALGFSVSYKYLLPEVQTYTCRVGIEFRSEFRIENIGWRVFRIDTDLLETEDGRKVDGGTIVMDVLALFDHLFVVQCIAGL